MDLDPTFHFDKDLDLAMCYGSGSFLFQSRNVPKVVLFVNLNLIFLISRSARSQKEGVHYYFSVPVNFVMIRNELQLDKRVWLLDGSILLLYRENFNCVRHFRYALVKGTVSADYNCLKI
jgi:hypothetical protein